MILNRKNARRLCLALLLVAFAVRIWGLTDVPPGLSGDESMNGSDALQVWQGYTPIFFTSNYGREALFLYSMALSLKLFGASAFAIRLTGVWYSFITLPLAYVLVKRLWNERAALLTLALLAVSFWPLFIGRLGLRATSMLPFQALALYTLWRGLQEGKLRWWILSGIGLGLVTYTYIPGRVFPIVAALWLLAAALTQRDIRARLAAHKYALLLSAAIALAIFAPFGWFIYQHPEQANQRIHELTWELDQLRAGNPRPALFNTGLTLKMFTFRGDSNPRYNLPGRPVFDWAIGACFYGGILWSLWHWRDPRHQLLLLWNALMLAPALITSEAPSFLRATGALLPIYALPAVALDAAWAWAARFRPPVARPLLTATIGAALLFNGGQSGYAYFHVWPRITRVREIYASGLAQVGRELDRHLPLPQNTTVLVGCDYAADLCRDMVRFQTHYTGPIKWFVGHNSLVIPPTANETLYLFGDGFPLPAFSQTALATGEAIAATSNSNGASEFAAYRVAPTWTDLPWQPQHPLDGRFRDSMALLGYDLTPDAPRGGTATLTLYWQVPETFVWDGVDPPRWAVTFNDALANRLAKAEGILPYAIWDWQPGDRVAQQIDVPIPLDMPPGAWTPQLEIFKSTGRLVYSDADGALTPTLPLSPVTITGSATEPEPEGLTRVGFAGELGLVDLWAPERLAPGEFILTDAHWHTLAQPTVAYAIEYQIHGGSCEGDSVYRKQEPIWPDRHPTSAWQPGEPMRTLQWPQLPPQLPNGDYALSLALTDGERATAPFYCGPLTVEGRPRQFEMPAIQTPLAQSVGEAITLLGYDLALPVAPGGPLNLTLYWQPQQIPTRWYISFVHLYSENSGNTIVSQHDSTPCNGYCPTLGWVPGEILTDLHSLTLPADLSPGSYWLGVGLYDADTFIRLSIPGTPNDALILQTVTLP